MKTTISIMLILFALSTRAQEETINVLVQNRDVEILGSFLRSQEYYEELYDATKKKYRVAVPPTGNTNVAIDSIKVWIWFSVMERIRKNPIAVGANVFDRLNTVLRAKNNAWLNGKLDEAMAEDTATYQQIREKGRDNLLYPN